VTALLGTPEPAPAASANDVPSPTRHLGLDGLRGLAVLGVLAYHGGFSWLRGGFLGVSMFFTLSGFLITGLLVAEHRRTGRISLRAFWGRRFRRLMPAAILTLAGVAAFAVFVADGEQVRALRWDALAALGYVANWRFVLAGRSYGEAFGSPSPVQHFWSLAIEEQFYVVFPLVVAGTLAVARGRLRHLAVVLLALVAGSVALTFRAGSDVSEAYFGTHTRAAELLVGALLALWWSHREHVGSDRSRSAVITVAGVAALALTGFLWSTAATGDPWLYRGGLLAVAVASATVILAALVRGPVRAVLSLRPLRAVGAVSYGLYLFHWPVFLWLTGKRTGLDPVPLFALRMAVTTALAVASYRFLEQPVLHRRTFTWRPLLVAPAAMALVAGALVAVTADPPTPTFDFGAASETAAAPPPPPVTVAPDGEDAAATSQAATEGGGAAAAPAAPVRVMVVGDSIAWVLGEALHRWSERTGRAVVWNVAGPGCGIARGGDIYDTRGASRPTLAGCDAWGERWPMQLAEFTPDVVLSHSGPWELTTRKLPAWPRPMRLGDPVHDRYVVDEFAEAARVLGSRGAAVVWMTMPCLHSYEGFRDALFDVETVQRFNRDIVAELDRRPIPTLEVLDLFGRICPGGEFTDALGGVEDARPDGVHFVDAAADWIADWIGPRLERAATTRTAGNP